MEFCEGCDNMLHIRINKDDTSTLSYECSYCGATQTKSIGDSCVYHVNHGQENKDTFRSIINKNICQDPTLPRITNIKCPNEDCDTNQGKATPEVLYIKYNIKDMKYLYICCICQKMWRNFDTQNRMAQIEVE